MAGLEDIGGRVTAVTGFEKGSGKTTFLSTLLPAARRSGPVLIATIGVDGRLKAQEAGRAAALPVAPGDLVLTTDTFARAASARLEVLEALPGRTVLGRSLLGRVVRGGEVTLAGAEHFSALAHLLDQARMEGWAHTALVDGAVNRITQVSALGDVQFVFTVRVDATNLARVAERLKALAALADLPVEAVPAPEAFLLEGPLTLETREHLPRDLRALSIEDFTKVFLEPGDLLRLLQRVPCSVRRAFPLLGISAVLKDLSPEAFREATGPGVAARLLPNPCEAAA